MSKKIAKKPGPTAPWYRQPLLLGLAVAGVLVAGLIAVSLFFSRPGERVTRPIGQDFLPEMGDPNAPVTIYEYADFQCPACGYFTKQYKPQLEEKHIKTGNVRFVYRNFIVKGESSALAAEAAYCAADQGGFWAYHDMLFTQHDRGVDFTKANLVRFARELGLKEEPFKSCLDSRKYRERVQEDHREGEQYKVSGTPSFVVNGRLVQVADPSVFTIWLGLLEAIQQNLPPGR